jgi:hypothetical protein
VKTWEKVQASVKLVWHISANQYESRENPKRQRPFKTQCGIMFRYPTVAAFKKANTDSSVPYCLDCIEERKKDV